MVTQQSTAVIMIRFGLSLVSVMAFLSPAMAHANTGNASNAQGQAKSKTIGFTIPKIMMPKSSWPLVMEIAITDGTVKVPACYSSVVLKNLEYGTVKNPKYISSFGTIWVHRTPEGYICESKMSTHRLGRPYKHDAIPENVKFETFAKNGVAKVAFETASNGLDPVQYTFPLNMHPVAPKIKKVSSEMDFPKPHQEVSGGSHRKTNESSDKSPLGVNLSASDRNAIASDVQQCWGADAGLPGASNFSVLLQVTTDQTGTVREAEVAPFDQSKMSNPSFARFASQAVNAVKSYQCAKLPLPRDMLGAVHTFIFRYTP
jgi:hypothetical protein